MARLSVVPLFKRRAECSRSHRLSEVVVHTGVNCLFSVAGHSGCGEGNDGNTRYFSSALLDAYSLRRLEAIYSAYGSPSDQTKVLLESHVEGLNTVFSDNRFET